MSITSRDKREVLDRAGDGISEVLSRTPIDTLNRAALRSDHMLDMAMSINDEELALVFVCATQALLLHLRERERAKSETAVKS